MVKIKEKDLAEIEEDAKELDSYAKFGVEFEGVYNRRQIEFSPEEIYSYHGQSSYDFGDTHKFKIESDGSIRYHGSKFDVTAEVISKPAKFSQIKDVLRGYSELIGAEEDDISKSVEFNSSTGGHIHITYDKEYNLAKDFDIFNKVSYTTYKLFTDFMTQDLAKYPSVKEQWFRSYAKKIRNSRQFRRDRYNSFNFNSSYRTIEVRSCNFKDLTKLSEVEDVITKVIHNMSKALITTYKLSALKTARYILPDYSKATHKKETLRPKEISKLEWVKKLGSFNGERTYI